MGSARNSRHMVMQNQLSLFTERVNTAVTQVQRQSETDRRRLLQLERKLEFRLDDKVRDGEGREKWAELQGSVAGLIEEMQAMTRRVEGLDERLWARTSGSELTKQRNRELEQQVQMLEQQGRLNQSTLEESQKRQATKLRRAEHSLEEALRRLAKVEEEAWAKQHAGQPRDGFTEARVAALEHQQERLDSDLRTLQMHFDDNFQGGPATVQDDGEEARLEEVVHSVERSFSSLEKKVSSQVEEMASSLASLRVKVDGQLQRVGTLAERMEIAHEPAIESLRLELAQARHQDRREVEAEMNSLRHRVQEAAESNEDTAVEVREALRQNTAQIAALSLRPEENSSFNCFDERLAAQEQDICDIRARLDTLPGIDEALGKLPEVQEEELDDFRRRLESLEEQCAAPAPSMDSRQAQNSICELVQGVSKLKQQVSGHDLAHSALTQQVQQLQGHLDRRWGEQSAAVRVPVEVEAKVAEMWEKVAELHARLLEVEGSLDSAPASDTLNVSKAASDQAGPDAGSGSAKCSADKSTADMKDKLEAVAVHLEVMDELVDRITELERQVPRSSNPLPATHTEVSFGNDDALKAAQGVASADLQFRVDATEKELQSLRDEFSKARPAPDASLQSQGKASQTLAGRFEKLLEATLEKDTVLDKVRMDMGKLYVDMEDSKDLRKDLENLSRDFRAQGDRGGEIQKLVARLNVLEERLEASGGHEVTVHSDEPAREQVQDQVRLLRTQVSEELRKLARFQEDLNRVTQSLQAVGVTGEQLREQASSIEKMQNQVDTMSQRLSTTAEATSAVKRDLEVLQAPREVGIRSGAGADPMAAVSQRLDKLTAQVAELQLLRGSRGSARGSRSPPRGSRSPPALSGEDSLVFSREVSMAFSQEVSREASLNFSLTDQLDRAGDGILNFPSESKDFSDGLLQRRAGDSGGGSPTSGSASIDSKASTTGSSLIGDASKKVSNSRLGELPDLKVHGRGGADILDSLIGRKAAGRTESLESADRGRGQRDVPVDTFANDSSSSSAGGRPRPSPLRMEIEERSGPLPPVAEEPSELGDQSFESHRSSVGQARKRAPLTKSPTGSPDSPNKSGSLDNSRSNLDASVSCQEVSMGHEVSIGHDYSVEDSNELDKCDFVEVVKPKGQSKADESTSSLENSPTLGARPRHSSESSGPKHSSESSGQDAKAAEEDYAAESFEESIEESVRSSESDAWGDEEEDV